MLVSSDSSTTGREGGRGEREEEGERVRIKEGGKRREIVTSGARVTN